MSKLALTEIQHQKMKKLLDDTYPTGRAIKHVQDKLEEL